MRFALKLVSLGLMLMAASIGSAVISNASDASFDSWLVDFRSEAKSQGISDNVLDAALRGAKPIMRVIELERELHFANKVLMRRAVRFPWKFKRDTSLVNGVRCRIDVCQGA